MKCENAVILVTTTE